MSLSTRIYKKNISNKKINDSSSESNFTNHKENNSTKQLQSFQNLADQYVNYQSDKNIQLQSKENKTGLPENIKSGVEQLSGYSLDDVKVHFNSSKPAQLKAHAYAEGNQIHVANGQEKHLAHEAWHVVQQKQNRVSPNSEINGVQINNDISLENEADKMGEKASSLSNKITVPQQLKSINTSSSSSIQGYFESGYRDKENIKSFSKAIVQRVETDNAEEQNTTADQEVSTEQDTSEEQSSFLDRSKEVLGGMIESIRSAGEAAFDGLSSAGNSLISLLNQMSDAAGGVLSNLANQAHQVMNTVQQYASSLAETVGLEIKQADKKKEQEENAFKAKYPKSQKFMEIMGAIVGKVLSLIPIVGPLLELKKRVTQGFRRFADWSVFSRAEDESSNGKGGLRDALHFAVGKAWRGFANAATDIGQTAISLASDIGMFFTAGFSKVLDFGNGLVSTGRNLITKARGLYKLFTIRLHKDRNRYVNEIVDAANDQGNPDHQIAVEILSTLGSGDPQKGGWVTSGNKDSGLYAAMDSKSGGKSTSAESGISNLTEASGIVSNLDSIGLSDQMDPTVVSASSVFEATEKRIEEDSLEAMKNA